MQERRIDKVVSFDNHIERAGAEDAKKVNCSIDDGITQTSFYNTLDHEEILSEFKKNADKTHINSHRTCISLDTQNSDSELYMQKKLIDVPEAEQKPLTEQKTWKYKRPHPYEVDSKPPSKSKEVVDNIYMTGLNFSEKLYKKKTTSGYLIVDSGTINKLPKSEIAGNENEHGFDEEGNCGCPDCLGNPAKFRPFPFTLGIPNIPSIYVTQGSFAGHLSTLSSSFSSAPMFIFDDEGNVTNVANVGVECPPFEFCMNNKSGESNKMPEYTRVDISKSSSNKLTKVEAQ